MKYYILNGKLKNKSPKDIEEWLVVNNNKQNIVDAFAAVFNQVGLISHDLDECQVGSKEYQWTCWEYNEWKSLYSKLLDRVIGFAQDEGFDIPEVGYYYSLVPFMEKYGYADGRGWWFEIE